VNIGWSVFRRKSGQFSSGKNKKEADYISNEKLKQTLMNYNNPPDELEVVTNTINPVGILYKVKK